MAAPFTRDELFTQLDCTAQFGRLPPDDCPISQERSTNCTKTACNHVFDVECLKHWLTAQDSCPMCRRRLYIDAATDAEAAETLRSSRLIRNVAPQFDVLMQIRRAHFIPYVSEAVKMVRGAIWVNDEAWKKVIDSIKHTLFLWDGRYLSPRQLRLRMVIGITNHLDVRARGALQYAVDIDPAGGMFERQVEETLDILTDLYANRIVYQKQPL